MWGIFELVFVYKLTPGRGMSVAVKQRWCVILQLYMFTATALVSVNYLLSFLSNEETCYT